MTQPTYHDRVSLGYGQYRCRKCDLSGQEDDPIWEALCPRAGIGQVFAVGDLVIVGPAYRMAEHPPFLGRHTYVSDAHTGYVGRIVKLDDVSAELAPANLLDVDESDAEVSINLKRLRKAT